VEKVLLSFDPEYDDDGCIVSYDYELSDIQRGVGSGHFVNLEDLRGYIIEDIYTDEDGIVFELVGK